MTALPTALKVVTDDALQAEHAHSAPAASGRAGDADESLYLIGRPKLKHFLRFVRHQAIEPDDESDLIEQWQEAKRLIAVLEKEEAGRADDPAIARVDVNSKLKPLLMDFLRDPLVQNGFNSVPTEIAWVDLNSLVVYQKHIDLSYVRQLRQRLGAAPGIADIFRTCLPYDHPHPPAKWSRLGDDSYIFVSTSNDLRFLGALPLQPENVRGYLLTGSPLGVLGLAVGFGSNFLNAIKTDNRLILNNGSHRAYALRSLGVTRVPCVVQHVSTRDELDAVASSEVRQDPDHFLKSPRPPMLKDYFDPRLIKVMQVQRVQRQIKVRFSVSEYYVPAL